MVKYRLRVNETKMYMYLLAFLIILSHSIYAYTNQRLVVNGIYAVLSFLPASYFFRKRVLCVPIRNFLSWLAIYLAVCMIYFLKCVDINDSISFVCRYVIYVPFLVLFFVTLGRWEYMLLVVKAIADIMYFIAIISLFFWIFGTILHIIPPSGTIYALWGNSYRDFYYGLYLEVPGRLFKTDFYRNVAIFCEAPAYVFFLGISLTFENLLKKRRDIKKILVFIISIITTGTSTGMLVLLFNFGAFYWLKTSKPTANNIGMRVLMILVAMIGCIFFLKFAFSDSKIASIILRKKDYINGFNVWRDSPLFGYGYMTPSNRFTSGFSNSISQLLIGGGIVLFGIYIISFVHMLIFSLNQNKNLLFWFMQVIILFAISVVGYAYISLTIIALGYAANLCRGNISRK